MTKIIVDCISDLHGHFPLLQGGDVLILAGDYTARGTIPEWADFFRWLKNQRYTHKIVVAGNHDNFLDLSFPKNEQEAEKWKELDSYLKESILQHDFIYLCDNMVKIDNRYIWGSPWTPWFKQVNPACMHFMGKEADLAKKFRKIPKNIDVLVTHGPAYGILDKNIFGKSCGSKALKKEIDRIMPTYHLFGHIHEQGGKELLYKHSGPNTWGVNCSYVNEKYKPVNSWKRIEI